MSEALHGRLAIGERLVEVPRGQRRVRREVGAAVQLERRDAALLERIPALGAPPDERAVGPDAEVEQRA